MSEYVYQEYPKCLYQRDGTTLVVENEEDEANASQMGWLTAEQYHTKPTTEELKESQDEESQDEE